MSSQKPSEVEPDKSRRTEQALLAEINQLVLLSDGDHVDLLGASVVPVCVLLTRVCQGLTEIVVKSSSIRKDAHAPPRSLPWKAASFCGSPRLTIRARDPRHSRADDRGRGLSSFRGKGSTSSVFRPLHLFREALDSFHCFEDTHSTPANHSFLHLVNISTMQAAGPAV